MSTISKRDVDLALKGINEFPGLEQQNIKDLWGFFEGLPYKNLAANEILPDPGQSSFQVFAHEVVSASLNMRTKITDKRWVNSFWSGSLDERQFRQHLTAVQESEISLTGGSAPDSQLLLISTIFQPEQLLNLPANVALNVERYQVFVYQNGRRLVAAEFENTVAPLREYELQDKIGYTFKSQSGAPLHLQLMKAEVPNKTGCGKPANAWAEYEWTREGGKSWHHPAEGWLRAPELSAKPGYYAVSGGTLAVFSSGLARLRHGHSDNDLIPVSYQLSGHDIYLTYSWYTFINLYAHDHGLFLESPSGIYDIVKFYGFISGLSPLELERSSLGERLSYWK